MPTVVTAIATTATRTLLAKKQRKMANAAHNVIAGVMCSIHCDREKKSGTNWTIQLATSAENDRTQANNITKAIMRGKRGDRTVRPSNNSPTTNEPRQ
jgi:hypothetical protein